jgi:uncharacterized protein (TIGR03437 family)
MQRTILAFAALPLLALAQKPVVSSVVNAASYQPVDATAPAPLRIGLLGAAIGTIFGTNLAASAASAGATPLPTKLAGTSVAYSGIPLPLLYVSSKQINFQMPAGEEVSALPYGPRYLVVTTAAGTSAPFLMYPIDDTSLGIFTRDSSGCGQGAVLNDSASGNVSINSPSNGVSPGDYISIFGTGLYIPYPPPDGTPAPADPPVSSGGNVGVVFDLTNPGVAGAADWQGLAPGLVGVGQINVQVPANVREGCAVPLQILGPISPPVTISIRKGGGSALTRQLQATDKFCGRRLS